MTRMYTSARHLLLLTRYFEGHEVMAPEIIDSVLTALDENTIAIHTLNLVSEDDFILTFLGEQHKLSEQESQRFLDAYYETFEFAVRDE